MTIKDEEIIEDIFNGDLCLILTYGQTSGLTKIVPVGVFRAKRIITHTPDTLDINNEGVIEEEEYTDSFLETYLTDEIEFVCRKTDQKIYIPVYACLELFKNNAKLNNNLLLDKDTKSAESLCWKLTQKEEYQDSMSERLERKINDVFGYGIVTSLLDVSAVYTDENNREFSDNYSLLALPSYVYKDGLDAEIDDILKEIGERKNK